MTTSITNQYTSLQKYKSLMFYFQKCWCSEMCERWVETGTDCYTDPSSSLDHSTTPFLSWLVCSTMGPEGPALSLQTGSHADIPVSDCPTAAGTQSIFFLNAHLLPLFFALFTQVHLLIDGSVKGQYNILMNHHHHIFWILHLPYKINWWPIHYVTQKENVYVCVYMCKIRKVYVYIVLQRLILKN